MSSSPFWQQTIEAVAREFKTDLNQGLSSSEAKLRLEKDGPNQLVAKKGISAVAIFLAQFKDFMVLILMAAAGVSGFLGERLDAVVIVTIVILNALLGFIQEYRAEKSLAALKELASPTAKVIRDGNNGVILSSAIVVGDLIELEAGDRVPADSRLIWISANFTCQESSLTGESVPVVKQVSPIPEKEVALGDRWNLVYLGTAVSSGKARAIVVAVGMQTELGKIAGMVAEIKTESTHLQKKLEEFGKTIVSISLVLVVLVFILGWLRGGKLIEVFMTSVSLAVAAIPEGLPTVVTISLALGVNRMVRRRVLIRKLPSVETLGSVMVICSDKTGTLTKNEMTVQVIFAGGQTFHSSGSGYTPEGKFFLNGKEIRPRDFPDLQQVLTVGVLCNGAKLLQQNQDFRILGDPTEAALLVAAAKSGIWKEAQEKEFLFVNEIPFDSERKKMTVIRRKDSEQWAFVKGAPDILLQDCALILEQGQARPMTQIDRERILKANDELADQAMRVLGAAYRSLPGDPEITHQNIETQLIFAGLFAMIDPARDEVRLAIAQCKDAGIRTVMITGDHKNTAVAIARSLGFFHEGALAWSGQELDQKSGELANHIQRIVVYARVSPEHKLKIVHTWRQNQIVVAMTGDGINDAPAVKEADIGVAMGITGTDVTKEVSDMIVTDDNFASIVAAIEEGRGIYENIRKFIHYLLSCNIGELLVVFLSTLLGWPVPLLPVHILWVNLVTDGLPALALGVEPVDPGIMKVPPRPADEPLIPKKQTWLILLQGSWIALCTLAGFAYVLYIEKGELSRARTVTFIILAVSQLFHSLSCRSLKDSVFSIGFFSNPQLIWAIGVSFVMQLAVVYWPFMQSVFRTEALPPGDWIWIIALSSLPFWLMEILKLLKLINLERSQIAPSPEKEG